MSPDGSTIHRLVPILLVFCLSGCSSYTCRAYFGQGENTAIRGYPTVGPPSNYTGVWTDYKYDDSKLDEVPYWNGKTHGTAFYYKDDGTVYLIREYKDGKFFKDDFIEPLPKIPSRIPFWFPAKYENQSVVSWNEEYTQKKATTPVTVTNSARTSKQNR